MDIPKNSTANSYIPISMEQHKPSPNAPSNSRQVESLHQISIPSNYEPIDLLVIDEVESTLAQFSSGLHKHFSSAFAAFRWMLQTARHVICMDANLDLHTHNTLQLMRGKPMHLHWNQFSLARDDQFFFTTIFGDWIGSILKALSSGQKIVIPMNCLKDAKAIEELLRSRFSGKKIELYSNETLPSKKKEHFGDIHTYWSELDVLIYTPTVSADISFESVHFDAIFACFTDNSCDVETCRQMLARVRNLSTREHFICFRLVNTCHSLPVTTDAISQQLHDKRTGLYQTVSDVALQFVDLVAYTGARVNVLPTHDPDDVKAHQTSFRMIKTDLENAHCEAVASSPKITDVHAFDIYERLENEEDVTVQEKNSFKKFNLLNFYDFGEEISPEFVKNYSKPAVKQVFTNLENITRGKTVDEALLKMRDHELKRYTDILGMEW
ncbi:putative replication origin-binding protein [Rhizophagus irregularis DAOM 181602=DAOM 197198]|nr:putative replication origin-binding protein [Rhizophagus irregularis DAOM 181602=DAOM 197198]